MHDKVIIQHRAGCFPVPVSRLPVALGSTIEEIAIKYHGGCDGVQAFVRGIDVEWEPIPREQWRYIRPKTDNDVLFVHTLQGGSSGNDIFAVVAMIALTAIAGPAGTAFASTAFATGLGISAGLATSAILVGGSLALQALFPGDQAGGAVAGRSGAERDAFANVTSESNLLAREAYLPVAINRRLSPPDVVQPHAFLEDGIQTVTRLLALDGYHAISDIQIDGAPIDDFSTVTAEIKDGNEATGQSSIVTNISAPVQIAETLPGFGLDGRSLTDQNEQANSEPRWIQFATPTFDKLEEISIRLRIDGAYKTSSTTQAIRVPLRLQVRAKGGDSGDWVSLPEIDVIGRTVSTKLIELRCRWDDAFGVFATGGELSYEFWQRVPEVTSHTLSDGSSGDQWQADSWWVNGAGLQDTKNITDRRHDIRVVLPTTLARGALEWRIKRGFITDSTAINASYQYGGNVVSRFLGRLETSTWKIPLDQGPYAASLNAVQATAIADIAPVQWPQTALVALKSSGQTFRNVTVRADRYIDDWNGSAWVTSTATSKNPASHYRQILYDWMVFEGIDTDLIDNASMVAWRQECIDRGYECSAVFAGDSLAETLSALATAGFAKPRFSDGFGIEYFRDRSGDLPVETFSGRNTSDLSFSIVSPERQFGYRVKFQNEDDEWRDDEIEVTIDNAADVPSFEAISYKAISNPDLVRRRATFDLLQIHERRREWKLTTAIKGVACEIGDLVSIVTDLFGDTSHGARIRQVFDTTHIALDQVIPGQASVAGLGDGSPPAVANILDAGERSKVLITTPTGMVERTIVGAEDNVIRLDSALPSTDLTGAHINIISKTDVAHRCFVVGIDRRDDAHAQLTLVDEAPQIFTKMNELFA